MPGELGRRGQLKARRGERTKRPRQAENERAQHWQLTEGLAAPRRELIRLATNCERGPAGDAIVHGGSTAATEKRLGGHGLLGREAQRVGAGRV
ncbi:hypothetical protein ERJ75_000652500 [Trypanosoma vivax]|nr:hypothetical protein ERJ75_000652500 [Trypanosoma vivax]